jgi:hypothetical protein
MINEFFQTTDYNQLPVSKSQKESLGKNIQFVNGSDFHTNIYDVKVASHKIVKYFQLGMFSQNYKKAIRVYVLEGTSPVGGTCLYEYKILKMKDYFLNDEYFEQFEKNIKKSINKNDDIKIMFKYYPVYNFKFTEPPSGNDITQCISELLG